jgi:hypothetical protein
MSTLKLSFHSTFALKKQDVLKILQAAQEEQGLNDSLVGLMQRTGLGNKKVSPIKSWTVRAGLVSHNHLTPEGVIIRDHDPLMTSPVTDWFMHFFLSFGDQGLQPPPEQPAEWGGWSYFVFTFLPEHPEFTLEDLVQASAPVFFKEEPRLLRENFRYVLRAYTEPHGLWACRFVQSLGENRFRSGDATLPGVELIGYFLAKLWQRDFGEKGCVSVLNLLNQPLGLAPILGIHQSDLPRFFTQLENAGLVRQEQQDGEVLLYRCWEDPLFLLEKAYQNC